MSDNTSIEWCDATWNPVTGCTEVSSGCDHCYAKTFAERWRDTPGHYFERGFDVQLRPDKLDWPLRKRKPQRIFVNSMSDLFHDQVPDDFIAKVFAIMALAPQHTFQLLTKRHARMRTLLNNKAFLTEVCEHGHWFAHHWERPLDDRIFDHGPYPLPNVWLGVSTENQKFADIRIPALLDTPAAVRFISAEPLLGPIDLTPCNCRGGQTSGCGRHNFGSLTDIQRNAPALHFPDIDWVIVGGESGHKARPMNPRWARSLRDQCNAAGVPFLFKQWGEWGPAPWKILGPRPDEPIADFKARAEAEGASHAFTGGLYTDDRGDWVENFMQLSHKPWSVERAPAAPAPAASRPGS